MSTATHEPPEVDGDGAWCTSTPRRGSTGGLRSVGTALDVLECFAVDSALGVSDVARRLGVAKSTAHRVLTTLATRGFVEQDANGLYRLGIHLYELGMLSHARNGLRHVAMPIMRAVAEQTGHTVNLGIPDGADIVFVERIESMDGVRILGHSGDDRRRTASAPASSSPPSTPRSSTTVARRASRRGPAAPSAAWRTGSGRSPTCVVRDTRCSTPDPSRAPARSPSRSGSRAWRWGRSPCSDPRPSSSRTSTASSPCSPRRPTASPSSTRADTPSAQADARSRSVPGTGTTTPDTEGRS